MFSQTHLFRLRKCFTSVFSRLKRFAQDPLLPTGGKFGRVTKKCRLKLFVAKKQTKNQWVNLNCERPQIFGGCFSDFCGSSHDKSQFCSAVNHKLQNKKMFNFLLSIFCSSKKPAPVLYKSCPQNCVLCPLFCLPVYAKQKMHCGQRRSPDTVVTPRVYSSLRRGGGGAPRRLYRMEGYTSTLIEIS